VRPTFFVLWVTDRYQKNIYDFQIKTLCLNLVIPDLIRDPFFLFPDPQKDLKNLAPWLIVFPSAKG